MLLYFSFVIFAIACLLNIWLIFYFIKSNGKNPPFIASFGRPKQEVIKQAGLFINPNPQAKVADLGCGSGSLLIPLARQFPDTEFVGYEWDIIPYMLAVYKTRNLPNVTIFYRDFFKEDLSKYDLVLCYLGTGIEEKIGSKLNKELAKDSLVISEVFKLAGIKLKSEICIAWGFIKAKVYLYTPDK